MEWNWCFKLRMQHKLYPKSWEENQQQEFLVQKYMEYINSFNQTTWEMAIWHFKSSKFSQVFISQFLISCCHYNISWAYNYHSIIIIMYGRGQEGGSDPKNWHFMSSGYWGTRAANWFLMYQKILFLAVAKVVACQSWAFASIYSTCVNLNHVSWKMNLKRYFS